MSAPTQPSPSDLRLHAVRVGLRRGWRLCLLSLRNPEDLVFYLLWGGGMAVYLILNRNVVMEGTDLGLPAVALPGIIAAVLVFGGIAGPAFSLVLEREDGTLLRAKSAPYGMDGYVTAQVVYQVSGALPMLAILLVPSAFIIDDLMPRGPLGWLVVLGLLVLGFLATMPIGMIIGSLARKPTHVSTWGMLPVLGLTLFSGVFGPVTNHAGWVQGLVQGFPTYWLGHLMRWIFLPDAAKQIELGGQWRLGPALLVLAAWAVVGLVLVPRVLRRMARRESGSAVEARMAERMQRVG
ncbi:ABC transporter permease [Actinotalea fermentans]|uniref:Transport permease protein n=1 Tax=Actinotalea fermentans TaxID=43671 RepID=A0A511Z0V5_9CELL|nr:ABC transporter permease [Actinotalea fermentans]KGM15015.1 ABC transporter [Actinotalea fermentans ATCC 43279 = JCM 9966 = DSM 3133]GEN81006.1 transport permease protein [Actinotalea fermentans]